MCAVGQRRVTVKGSVDGQGRPVPVGLRGTVIGHLGQLAIVTLDGPEYERENVLIPDMSPGVVGLPRRVEVAPSGEVRPSRGREKYRQRR
jgi:hypothetical protein